MLSERLVVTQTYKDGQSIPYRVGGKGRGPILLRKST